MQNQTPGVTPAIQADPGITPLFSVVRGEPTDTELAALVTVLAARAGAAEAQVAALPVAGRSRWSDRSRLLREPLSPGPGAWRRSALPA